MVHKVKPVDAIVMSSRGALAGCLVGWYSVFFLLRIACCQELAGVVGQRRVKTISDPVDFFNVMRDRSADIIYLLDDIDIRNYYGWVVPRSYGEKIELSRALEMKPARQLERRVIIDIDGHPMERMISGIADFKGERLHWINMRVPEHYGHQGHQSNVTLVDCVVEMQIESEQGGIFGTWQSLSSSISEIDEGGWQLVDDPWCKEEYSIDCPFHAAYFPNSSMTFKGVDAPEGGKSRWIMQNTLIKFVEFTTARVSRSSEFQKAVAEGVDVVEIPHDIGLSSSVCRAASFVNDTIIQDPLRSYPPSTFIDFKRSDECMMVNGARTLRVSDLIFRNLLYYQWWPDLFPFVIGNESTIVLENVIVDLDIDQSYYDGRLDEMVFDIREQGRPRGLGEGYQYVEKWNSDDCIRYQKKSEKCRNLNRCSPDALCPQGGIFIKDAAFVLSSRYGIHKAGTKYHVLQSLFRVVTYSIEPSAPLAPEPESENDDGKRRSRLELLLPILLAVIGVLMVVLLVCTGFSIWNRWQLKAAMERSASAYPNNSVNIKDGVEESGQTGVSPHSIPPRWDGSQIPPREDQIAANKLLGSVTLGPLLGMGSFGRVYKGTWNGATCAVKVISHSRGNSAEVFAYREAGISTDLHHPNVVQTFIKTTRTFDGSNSVKSEETVSHGSSGGALASARSSLESADDAKDKGYVELAKMSHHAKGPLGSGGNNSHPRSLRGSDQNDDNWDEMSAVSIAMETWLVQEWCDKGSLDRLVERGIYLIDGLHLDMLKVVDTCLDICRGMTYLKNKNVIHGDLKTSNVLVSGCLHEPKGFTAKVADFGLSRQLGGNASHIKTRTTGTVTHMPPELFKEERLTTASDVYSFGILMWELVAGEPPLAGVPHFVVIKKILMDSWRPTFPDECPQCYQILAKRCWDATASTRPSFETIMRMLSDMRSNFTASDPGRCR